MANSHPFQFMACPLEIRYMIYRFALTVDHYLTRTSLHQEKDESLKFTGLLRVSKQIHYEKAPIFYSSNAFVFKFAHQSCLKECPRDPAEWFGLTQDVSTSWIGVPTEYIHFLRNISFVTYVPTSGRHVERPRTIKAHDLFVHFVDFLAYYKPTATVLTLEFKCKSMLDNFIWGLIISSDSIVSQSALAISHALTKLPSLEAFGYLKTSGRNEDVVALTQNRPWCKMDQYFSQTLEGIGGADFDLDAEIIRGRWFYAVFRK